MCGSCERIVPRFHATLSAALLPEVRRYEWTYSRAGRPPVRSIGSDLSATIWSMSCTTSRELGLASPAGGASSVFPSSGANESSRGKAIVELQMHVTYLGAGEGEGAGEGAGAREGEG